MIDLCKEKVKGKVYKVEIEQDPDSVFSSRSDPSTVFSLTSDPVILEGRSGYDFLRLRIWTQFFRRLKPDPGKTHPDPGKTHPDPGKPHPDPHTTLSRIQNLVIGPTL